MEEYKLNSKYQILSDSGWKNFSGIRKLQKDCFYKIKIKNQILVCSENHKIYTNNGWVEAKNLSDQKIFTNNGFKSIIEINRIQESIELFDLINVDELKYFTNSILSHNCSFIGSANTLIEANKLNELSYGKAKSRNNEGLIIYHEPIKANSDKNIAAHQYFITVDTARGQGKDNSAFVVIDITEMPYKVVAKYKNNTVSPLLFPSYIRAIGKKYNDAHVLVEINDIGSQVADILHNDLQYENLIKSSHRGVKGQTISEVGAGHKAALGVRTTLPVKKLGCSVLKNLVENDKIILEDHDIIDELTSFIADNQSFRADDGHNDDLVMCLVLFSWATRQEFFESLTDSDIRLELYNDEINQVENEILPFGFVENGQPEQDPDGEWDGNDRWFPKKNRSNSISSQFWIF